MYIALIICIPITAAIVGILVLKSVQLGLKWKVQVEQKQLPTIENPIKQVIDEHKQEQAIKQYKSTYEEWVNGKEE
jgi:hypothetical protein